MPPKKPAAPDVRTTAQRLSSIIKSCRDLMRKDKGLSGDADRIPMLTWILFLKFLDDQEHERETEAKLNGERFRPTIEAPYRWRDWAAKKDGLTGDKLYGFIGNERATRPDGREGAGLFAYLRGLEGSGPADRRDTVRSVFDKTVNRMTNGYLIRDVLNKVSEISFSSRDEIHTLSHLYESMLKEMRDAAGDAGEFYTPRPVVRLIVDLVDPQLGEKILDPACGTGGFLVEAFAHLSKRCKTPAERRRLEREALVGCEAKPLPYLLAQMNLVLHGVPAPEIDSGNALRFPLGELGDRDRVDVIMTNPPFGGEEEASVLKNFPDDKRTSETALLFLQLIMRKLRREVGGRNGGRAGVVVPNGTLFSDGVGARIKQELLEQFNLHTIVRLPQGVFAPYTDIPTNLLFFERTGKTKDIWFYEHATPEDRKKYTKTKPLRDEEFAALKAWWGGASRKGRKETERAWRVPVEQVVAANFNLDLKNPRSSTAVDRRPPEQIVDEILEAEARIAELLREVKRVLHGEAES